MTNKEAKMYQISQRNINMVTDNQHGADACNKAIEALDKIDRIDAIVNDCILDDCELLQMVRNVVNC